MKERDAIEKMEGNNVNMGCWWEGLGKRRKYWRKRDKMAENSELSKKERRI